VRRIRAPHFTISKIICQRRQIILRPWGRGNKAKQSLGFKKAEAFDFTVQFFKAFQIFILSAFLSRTLAAILTQVESFSRRNYAS
jgi:hypothetical protein